MKAGFRLFLELILVAQASVLFAQDADLSLANRPLNAMLIVVLISVIPLALMMTSFVKISVVLAIVRNAIGTYHIPPNTVILGLSLILTIYTMAPVGMEINKAIQQQFPQYTGSSFFTNASLQDMLTASKIAKVPISKFLSKYAHSKDKKLFYSIIQKTNKNNEVRFTKDDLIILVPAFMISQLKEAFEIGFVIYIPFLIIDLLVSNILLSLGMFMVSPTTISLPFKLLLFVLADGWFMITKGLIESYLR